MILLETVRDLLSRQGERLKGDSTGLLLEDLYHLPLTWPAGPKRPALIHPALSHRPSWGLTLAHPLLPHMDINRKFRSSVPLGIHDETVFTGDHLAYFYETEQEFALALGFLEIGFRGNDHGVIFGISEDTEHMLR